MAYKGGARPKAKLTYDYNTYTPYNLKNLSDNAKENERLLRKEYSRLRSIAQKRLKRMSKSEFADSKTYKNYRDKFSTTRSIKTEAQLRAKLSELARFVQSDRGSVSGQKRIRAKAIKTLNENGFDNIDESNFKEFAEFMDETLDINKAFAKSSDQVADFFDSLTEQQQGDKKYLREAMRNWSRSRQTREKLDRIQNRGRRDSRQFRRSLE